MSINFLKKLLGGRPMRCDGFLFRDLVSGKPIYGWTDTLGRRWLAESAWSIFRVEIGS